jgi:endo-1,4-beta-xylanase
MAPFKRRGTRALSVFVSAVVCMSTMGLGTCNTKAAAVTADLVTNGTFEDGTTNGWSDMWGNCTLTASTEQAHEGSYSMLVTDRKGTWAGPQLDVLGKMEVGHTYEISVWIRAQSGSDTASLTIKRKDSGGSEQYDSIIYQQPISASKWTNITGTYTLTDTNSLDELAFYIEATKQETNFYVDDISIIDQNASPKSIQTDIPSLKDVIKSYPIGTCLQTDQIGTVDGDLIVKHFNSITPGNEFKPDYYYDPNDASHKMDFTKQDQLVDFAIAHNMIMRGHTFCWANQTPDWFFQDPTDSTKTATKEQLRALMKKHITTVLEHFKTKYGKNNPIYCWDVVNEPITEDGRLKASADKNDTANYNMWGAILGEEYIEDAFRYAHEADPSMKLFINDYNLENNNAKTQGMYDLVKRMLAKGVPIDGIGIQMHITATSPSIENIKAAIEKLGSLGLPIQITELDMGIDSNTAANRLLQARRYKELFDLFELESKKGILKAVTIWGSADISSWRQTTYPLLFDNNYQAKPAYWAIVDPSKLTQLDTQVCKAYKGSPKLGSTVDSTWSIIKGLSTSTYAKGVDGASASVKAMWDDQNLYLFADVADSTVAQNDSVEFLVDNNGTVKTYRVARKDAQSGKDLTLYVSSTSKGYTVQAAIPIASLKPQKGNSIGFDVRVNDDRGSGTVESVSVWNDYLLGSDATNLGSLSLAGEPMTADCVYGTPSIDGTVDDIWANAKEITTGTWVTGTSGATAKVKTMWDEKNLYILAIVTDPVLSDKSANEWEQDSVEIFVDQNNHKTSSYETDDGQYRVNFKNLQSFGSSTPQAGFKSAATVISGGYLVEMAIPWTELVPKAGTLIGFDAQVNDGDESGTRTGVVTWCDPSGSSYMDTSGFGNLVLVKAEEPSSSGSESSSSSSSGASSSANSGSSSASASSAAASSGSSQNSPKTGDTSDMFPFLLCLLISGSACAVLVIVRKAQKKAN